MQDLNDKITGNTLEATEWNEVPSEIQNVIEGLGQTLSSGDLNQLGKGIAGYVSNGAFYTDSGAANAYVLSKIGTKQAPTSYTDGFYASFLVVNDNTGASTVNVVGLGLKDIKLRGGADPAESDISGRIRLAFDAANDRFELLNPQVTGFSKTFDTVSSMKADPAAKAGQFVAAKDYASGRNSGVLFFEWASGAAPSPDGGSQIDHDSLPIHAVQNFPEIISTKMFGASVDGVTNDTVEVQAAIDYLPPRLLFSFGVCVVSQLELKDSTTVFIGTSDVKGSATSSLRYDAAASASGAVFNMSSLSAGNKNRFEQLDIDTNDRAATGFYLASGTAFQAIKNMTFDRVFVTNLKSGAVGWQIGDTTNTTFDTDAWNHNFRSCHARGSEDSIGWVVDAQNAYNISWYDCSHGRKNGSNFMLTGIKTIRGSGFRVYNYFSDRLQSTGDPWGIDHNSGSMQIFGMNTEDYRCVRARTIGRSEDGLTINGMQVNDSDGDDGVSVDSTCITSIHDSIFKTIGGGDNRIIKCTNRFYANNVDIGSSGEYQLTGEPRRNVLEGMRVGSLCSLNNNTNFHFWVPEFPAANVPPVNWGLNKGSGTATIEQSTVNANIGRFTTHINCSVANVGDVMGISMSREIPISAYRGTSMNLVAVATRDTTESIEVECLVDGVNVMIGGSTVFEESASGGKILAWGRVEIPANGSKINSASVKVGIPSANTGEVWVDGVFLIPLDFTGRIPALWQHIQHFTLDEQLEGPKVNNIDMSGNQLWIDGSNKLRINVGYRISDVDGTIVGNQT